MKITTRISTKVNPGAGHHPECEREHAPLVVTFMSASPFGGIGRTETTDCMLYEMEDAAFESVTEAYGLADYDSGLVYDIAANLASLADGLLTGEKTNVRHLVEAV